MKLLKSNAVLEIINSYLVDSPSPSNLSYVWSFGSLLGVCLVLQIISGVILAMHYTANTGLAFESIEHIMRDVNNGWLIRYMHANVASFFFIFVYLHIGKGIYYNSYKAPRLMLWNIGVAIYFMMMAIAFLGIILCLRYKGLELGLELGLLLMPISPELKKRLDEKEIKPIVVYENLETAESKEQIRSEIRGKAGVYGIFNKVTGDLYIGSGVNNNLFARLSDHLYVKRGNKKIARDIAEYGLSSFAYLILEYNLEEITEQNIS